MKLCKLASNQRGEPCRPLLPETRQSLPPSDMKNDDQPFPSSSPQAITRRLYPQKSAGTGQNGISSILDEVTFLRLPGVKAITGLSKVAPLRADSREEFSRPCSAWSTHSSVGKIRNQTMGFRAHTCVTVGRIAALQTVYARFSVSTTSPPAPDFKRSK